MKRRLKINSRLVQSLAAHGMSEDAIAEVLELNNDELKSLLGKPVYFIAMQEGKKAADENVLQSLYKRATGYELEQMCFARYKGKISSRKYTKKHLPSLQAIMFWLKNRKPADWNKKPKKDERMSEEEWDMLRRITVEEMDRRM